MTAPLSSLAELDDERFTEAQRAKVAEFDAAPEPPEIVVERVARAIWEADFCAEHVAWENDAEQNREDYRRLAAAAIAAMPPSLAEEDVKRVEALVEELEQDAEATLEQYAPSGPFDSQIVVQARGGAYAQQDAADRIRAALDPS